MRSSLALGVLIGLAWWSAAGQVRAEGQSVPVLYSTDLLHPHDDPDDHYDLACLFALGEFDVRGIVLDLGERQVERSGEPAVRQMRRITGRIVPTAMGLGRPLRSPTDEARDQPQEFQAGVELILTVLRASAEPVTIFTTGSCRDVAVAFNRAPELLRAKVKAIYMNVGRGGGEPQNEWNVMLDPQAYVRMFESGLPLYWCPCFGKDGFATHYVVDQATVLAPSTQPVRSFFVYCLTKAKADPLEFLERELPVPQGPRNMWCTAPLLHAAGRTVYRGPGTADWVAVGRDEAARQGLVGREAAVYDFVPARVTIERGGASDPKLGGASVKVDLASAEPNGRIFRVLEPSYPAVMASCLRDLLGQLGR